MRDVETADVESAHTRDTSDQQVAPMVSTARAEPAPERDISAGNLVFRLLVGVLLEGSDEALSRLRRWNEHAQHHTLEQAPMASDHRLRWMLVGLLLETEASARSQLDDLRQRGTRALYHPRVTLHSLEESMREWLPSGFVRRVDRWRAEGQQRRARWITEGYLAEQEGRELARSATQAAVEELLGYMARNPQVRSLIEQQSLGLADEAVDEVRARAASADTRLEHIAHAILRRAPSSHPPATAGQAPNASPDASHAARNSGYAEKTP